MKLKSIQTKISFTYIFFAVITLITVGFIINFAFETQIKENIKKNLHHHIDFLERYLSDISIETPETIDDNLKQIAGTIKIRITLIDEDGIVILDSDIKYQNISKLENHLNRPEIISSVQNPTGNDIRKSVSTGIEYFYVAKNVNIEPKVSFLKKIKFIRTSISLNNLNIELSEMRWMIAIGSLVVLLFILILSILISKRITSPLKKIVTDLSKISKGNYEHKLEIESNDEMKILADSINQLVQKINNDIIELNKLSKVRSQFLANVSHELRTPLFSIEAMLETLLNGALDDKKVNKEYLQRSLDQVDRLNLLLSDLIEISRMESGEQKLSLRYFDLYDLVNSVLNEIKPSFEKKNINIIHNTLAGMPSISAFGDKEKLYQVFYNLLDNALKYNPSGTEVRINYSTEKSLIHISVEDNGVGIPEKHLPRIFERFYRVDKSRSRESGGTGLGLSIVKHIIEAHGSKVDVSSIVGKWTKFTFYLKYDLAGTN